MSILWKNKFIVFNIVLVLAVKAVFTSSGLHLAALVQDLVPFSRSDIIRETNEFRQESGLRPLAESITLDIAAAQKLQDMVQNQYFAHFSPAGVSPWHWFELNRYSYSYAGENLAIGFLDAETTVQAWINSPAHRKNLANAKYEEIGVAVADAKIKDIQGIIVVQLFGAPVSATKVSAPLSLNLSRSGAQGIEEHASPTPTPATTSVPSAAPVPSFAAVPSGPVPVSSIDTGTDAARVIANRAVIAYTLMVALAAVLFLLVRQVRREFLVKAAVHIAIFALAATLPLLDLARPGFIF